MATFTASQLRTNVYERHAGLNVTAAAVAAAVTGTASSVVLLSRVPTGATLVDFWMRLRSGGVSQTVKIGTSASPSGIMSITTLSVTYSHSATAIVPTDAGVMGQWWIRAPGGTRGGGTDLMPVRISLSDDVQPAEVWIQATMGVAISASLLLSWCLFYLTDGMPGHTTIR